MTLCVVNKDSETVSSARISPMIAHTHEGESVVEIITDKQNMRLVLNPDEALRLIANLAASVRL